MDERPEVVITRSTRRRKTLSARRVDGAVHVAVPAGMPPELERQQVDALVEKVLRKEWRARDAGALRRRAERISQRYFDGRAEVASITWSGRQRQRWGSCQPRRRVVILSDALATMPDWVIDAVVVHELAHLFVPGHGPEFRALVTRYPDYDRAMAFLDGVAHGWRVPPPGAGQARPGSSPDSPGPSDSPEPLDPSESSACP